MSQEGATGSVPATGFLFLHFSTDCRLPPWYHRGVNETAPAPTIPRMSSPPLSSEQVGRSRRVVLLGGFGMRPKATMRYRALPLGQELAAAGCDVTMVLPSWDCPEDAGRVWTESGVRVVSVALPRRGPAFVPALVRALVMATRAARPDVVHLFKPKGYGGLAARSLRGLPLVVDHDDWEGAGGWNDVGQYSAPQRALFAWQERDLPRRAAHCTVASRTLETQLWAFGVPPARVAYLPNALRPDHAGWRDTDATRAAARAVRVRLGLAGPTALLYTRFVEFAPERVAAVFARVRERVPGARLLVIGGGLRGEDGAARGAFAPLGDATVWAGNVPFDALPGYLRAADVALVPFADTPINRAKCSVKTFDLLALGVPVVATAVGENLHAIRGGETGLLVPPGDDAAMADALVALLTDGERAARMGAAARTYAWQTQTWAAQTPAVLDIYRRVAHAAGRRRR